ncbi:hypothetical protein FA15DRAFT_590168 [Coprinopsis marcescibilis]|uniref:CHAT domain-containing protein n=1 Tax=Coprinopsis marcescibilis TaxID=230819 RepID=A0A5C3LBE8_COPMA|nr:hypothetical protein FA15DRAFT_590168 [Coprinopsis marcescibilis]
MEDDVQSIAKSLPIGQPLRFRYLLFLWPLLWDRFIRTGAREVLEEASKYFQKATREDEEAESEYKEGIDLLKDCQRGKGDSEDLEDCISMLKRSLELRPPTHPIRTTSLGTLASALFLKYEKTGSLPCLDQAISLRREALALRSSPFPATGRSLCLHNLAQCLSTSFDARECVADLEEAIQLQKEAVALRPAPNKKRPLALTILAIALRQSFTVTNDPEELDESMSCCREALELMPHSDSGRTTTLGNLGTALRARFETKGSTEDLEEMVRMAEQALEMDYLAERSSQFSKMHNLGVALTTRFERKGDVRDLERAINLFRGALEHPPAHGPAERAFAFGSLASALGSRFELTGSASDLSESISQFEKALKVEGISQRTMAGSMTNLGESLRKRYETTGKVTDLDRAFELLQQALELRSPNDRNRPKTMTALALLHRTMYQQRGDFSSLEEAVQLHRAVCKSRPLNHPERPYSLSNLALTLKERFDEKREEADLEEAISTLQEALSISADDSKNQVLILNNLALVLRDRFNNYADRDDLNAAVAHLWKADNLTPDASIRKSGTTLNLAVSLQFLFKETGHTDLATCDQSIDLLKKALDLCPPPHVDRISRLHSLAGAFSTRWAATSDQGNRTLALEYFRQASTYEPGHILLRLKYTKDWANFARSINDPSELEAYSISMDLLPSFASLELPVKRRQAVLSQIKDIACDAAKCAISYGNLELAAVFLSTGRSVFWSQALQLRPPLGNLEAKSPELAQRFRAASQKLEKSAYEDSDSSSKPSNLSFDSMSTARSLVDDWQQVLTEIRALEGFETFLRPKTFDELQESASNGPVVLLTSSLNGSDALIVTTEGVKHIPYPQLEYHHLATYAELFTEFLSATGEGSKKLTENQVMQLEILQQETRGARPAQGRNVMNLDQRFKSLLKTIWMAIVRPIVVALGLSKSTNPPRLWWCPTGLFVFLPLHAAGIYGESTRAECLTDYAISSYCTSLQDLLHPPLEPDPQFKLLAVIQPEAVRGSNLPMTLKELEKIEAHLPSPVDKHLVKQVGTKSSPTTVDEVLTGLTEATIAHFGCHGKQNTMNPLQSCLLLSGGELSMSRIIRCQTSKATLAYLSACETAKSDDASPDESMHLAATMMFAGFRGVVGTLCEIRDEDAPVIADGFYRHLFLRRNSNGDIAPDAKDAAAALHFAVKKLRDDGKEIRRWIPYVHFGI